MNAALFTLVTLACGWAALWPIRRRLGTFGYHVAAYPLGLLAWCAVVFVGEATGGAWDAFDAVVGLGAAVGAVALVGWLLGGRGDGGGSPAPAWTYAAWGGTLVAVAAGLAVWGITAGSYDSVYHYADWGVWFADGGGLIDWIAGAYGPLIPAVCAGGRLLGIDWMSTPWPLLAGHVLAIVVVAVRTPLLGPLGGRRATYLAVAATVLLASTAPFVGQVLYLHSHMISTAYLLLAVFAIWRGLGSDEAATCAMSPAMRASWLWVGGLATAALAFARVDGLAYAVVPLVLAGAIRIDRRLPGRVLLPAVLGAALPLAAYYGVAFVSLGGWQSADKLTGRMAAYVLVGLALVAALAMVAERVPGLGRALQRTSAGPWVLSVCAIAIGSVAALTWESFFHAVTMMATNLGVMGGFGTLWWVIAAMMVLSLATRRRWSSDPWPMRLLLAVALFFTVAVAVHGVGHPGRIGPADSFSRVAFHVVPLVFWYAGLFAGGVLAAREGTVAEGPEGQEA